MTPEEASSFWLRRARSFMTGEPRAFALLTLRKAALLWNAAEIPNHLNYRFMRERAWILRLMPIGFGVVAPLGAIGLALSLLRGKRRRETILLIVVAAGVMVSVLPFFVAERYRAPMVPPLIVAAGFGITAVARALTRHARGVDRRLAAPLLSGAVVGVVSWLPLTHPDTSRDHWLFAQAYRARGDLDEARAEYEAAVAESAGDGVLLNNLGNVYRALGRGADAESAFRRAIAAGPRLSLPRKNLAMLLLNRGRRDEALTSLEEAVKLDSADAEAFGAIAMIRAERGEQDEAATAYATARRLDPADPRLARLRELYPYLAGGDGPR